MRWLPERCAAGPAIVSLVLILGSACANEVNEPDAYTDEGRESVRAAVEEFNERIRANDAEGILHLVAQECRGGVTAESIEEDLEFARFALGDARVAEPVIYAQSDGVVRFDYSLVNPDDGRRVRDHESHFARWEGGAWKIADCLPRENARGVQLGESITTVEGTRITVLDYDPGPPGLPPGVVTLGIEACAHEALDGSVLIRPNDFSLDFLGVSPPARPSGTISGVELKDARLFAGDCLRDGFIFEAAALEPVWTVSYWGASRIVFWLFPRGPG